MVLEHADRLLREQEGNLRQWRQTMGEPASRQETSSTATASADSVPVDGRLVTPATTSGTSDQEKAEPPGPVKRGHGGATVGVDGAGPATSDAELRAAIVNVARDYLRLAKTRTHAQVEALIWGDTSGDSADFVPSDIAFAKLTLELAAQATGLPSWAAGRATYPWPLPTWADVRVDTNPASPVFASMVADAREHGRWHPLGDGYQPQPGDWALYDEHIAVVTNYADGVLDTIDADSRPDLTVRAHCSSAPLAEQGVTGFIDNGSLKPTSGSPGMPAQHAPAATRRVADADVAAKVVSQLKPYGRQVHKARAERLYEQQLPARVHTAFFACAHTPIRRMEPMYKDIARQAGISWELLAACDWMQCHSKLDLSPVHGERLGRLNADGTSYSTKSAALTQCAREFTDLSAMVYGIDLTTRRALSVWDLAAAFAAFGWGMILRRHGVSPMEFPYSVAGLTALHQKMHWPYIDAPESPNRPGARFREPFGAVPVVLRLGYPATV